MKPGESLEGSQPPDLDGSPSTGAKPGAPDIAPKLLRTIGEYEIKRELGRGAMGVVYLARETSVDRLVALKVLPPQLALSDESVERFRREARAVAGLDHDNIVPIYQFGETQDSVFFYSMRYVEGTTLEELLTQEKVEPDRAARLIVQVARGLAYSHEHGILHRDLKPGNVMVTADDRALVMDFGLAKDIKMATMTEMGDVMGTPAYMSPEQALGVDVDTRSDVYGLGAALYEALTLQTPFDGDNIQMIMLKVIEDDPRPPSMIVPDLPEELETIVLKAMEKDPNRRYLDMQAFAEDLQRYLDGEPILAKPPSQLYLALKWVRRRRKRIVPAAIVLVIMLAVMGVMALRYQSQFSAQWVQDVEAKFAVVERQLDITGDAGHATPEGLIGAHAALQEAVELMQLRTIEVLGGEAGIEPETLALIRETDDVAELAALLQERGLSLPRDMEEMRPRLDEVAKAYEDARVETGEGLYLRAVDRLGKQREEKYELLTSRVGEKSEQNEVRRAIARIEFEAEKELKELLRIDPDHDRAKGMLEALLEDAQKVLIRVADANVAISYLEYDAESDLAPIGGWKKLDALFSRPVSIPHHGVLRIESDGHVEARIAYRFERQAAGGLRVLEAPALIRATDLNAGMVHVVGGPYLAGGQAHDSESKAPIERDLPAFLADRHEVTRGEFAEFVDAGGYANRELWSEEGWRWLQEASKQAKIEAPKAPHDVEKNPEDPDLPVVGVSFFEAEAYARYAGKRLPTVDEWEKAARGVDGRYYPWGNAADPEKVWELQPRIGCAKVGSTRGDESPYGLFDCGGNVMEWTSSHPRSRGGAEDGRRQVTKGSAWAYDPKMADRARCAARSAIFKVDRQPFIGFRCVMDVPTSED